MKNTFYILFITVLLIAGCKKNPVDNVTANKKPNAFLWIYPNNPDSLLEGISRQHIHWWGEDVDGYVVGFLVGAGKSELMVEWTFKTKNDSLIAFPLDTLRDTFHIYIKSIDNSLIERIDDGAVIRLGSPSYWDKNKNNIFDSSDVYLRSLTNALSATATEKFPILNSPPSVSFETNGTSTVQLPDTTFTILTVAWTGTDPDGDKNISKFQIALNDTSAGSWASLDSTKTTPTMVITLLVPRSQSDVATTDVDAEVYTGTYGSLRKVGTVHGLLLNSLNRIFLRAVDLGGDNSPVVSLPDSGYSWYVKKPTAKLLVVEDYASSAAPSPNSPDSVGTFYRKVFSEIQNGPYPVDDGIKNFDFLSVHHNSIYHIPFHLDPEFILTLQLFDYVFWYSGQQPTWKVAATPLFLYAVDPASSGRVIFSTAFQFSLPPQDSIAGFTPIDSASTLDSLLATRAYADTTVSNGTGEFPQLKFKAFPAIHSSFFYRQLYPRTTSRGIYQIDSIVSKTGTKFSPTVGVLDVSNRFVFMGVPLHLINGLINGKEPVPIFLNKVFGDIFTR